MALPILASRAAEWVAIAATVIGGGMWVGSVDTQTTTNKEDITALQPVAQGVAVDIGVLKERTDNMGKALDEIKQQQKDILTELRK